MKAKLGRRQLNWASVHTAAGEQLVESIAAPSDKQDRPDTKRIMHCVVRLARLGFQTVLNAGRNQLPKQLAVRLGRRVPNAVGRLW